MKVYYDKDADLSLIKKRKSRLLVMVHKVMHMRIIFVTQVLR